MPKVKFLFLFIMLILSSCRVKGDMGPEKTPANITQTYIKMTNTVERITKTPTTQKTPITPAPTIKPKPSKTPNVFDTLEDELQLSGTIWIKRFTMINLDTGAIKKMRDPECNYCHPAIDPESSRRTGPMNPYCVGLLPHSVRVVCEYRGDYYIKELLSNEKIPLPDDDLEWFRWSSTGRYLYYLKKVEGTDQWEIISYDLQSEKTRKLFQYNEELSLDWMERSALSYDGKYLAVVGYISDAAYGVIGINTETSSIRQIWTGDGFVSYVISWSPTELKLVFGVQDYESEIIMTSNPPNVLLLADLEKNSIRELARADDQDHPYAVYYTNPWQSIWSPDGKKVAVLQADGDGALCIIDVDTGNKTCNHPNLDVGIFSYAWSPTSDALALSTPEGLVIYSFETNKLYKIYDLKGHGVSVYWRE